MVSSLVALIFVSFLWSANSQRINAQESILDKCRSGVDYLSKFEDLRNLMLEQRDEFIRDNQELKNRLTLLETIWNERKVCSGKTQCLGQKTQCAFYAYYSADFKSLPKGKTFIFDTVVTNIGNGYNESTGAFIAPTPGVFAFSWTLHAAGRHIFGESGQYGEMGALLKQNGIIKGSIAADTERKSNQGTATGFVILNLTAGDEVKIVSKYDGQGSMYSNDVYGRTTFSGFLIYP